MARVILKTTAVVHHALNAHLLRRDSICEEAAFVFATAANGPDETIFESLDHLLVPPSGFVVRSPCFLELKDEVRAQVIKRAHNIKASIIELHSHPQYG